jgi:hypothetical protein
MVQPSGQWLPLSLPRRFIGDLISIAGNLPNRTMEGRIDLSRVIAARQSAWPRPGWCAIFVKAYGIVAARRPQLRQIYRPLPWPHLYEHPENVASIAIARDYQDEEAVFFARLACPENLGLLEIDRAVRDFKERPIESIPEFRRQLRLARLPLPLRRIVMWLGFNGPGRHLADQLGTVGVNAITSQGAWEVDPLSPWTMALSYGVLAADGTIDVRLTYDPRARDAIAVARALTDLEDVLQGEIVNELGYMKSLEAA